MSNSDGSHDGSIITPYKVERVCNPHPNIQQLSLKEVDTTESVYTRTLVQLKDASLPDVVLHGFIQPTVGVTYIVNLPPTEQEPVPPQEPEPPPPPPPQPPQPPDQEEPPEPSAPEIISWDLFLMLKYRQDWRPSGYGLGDLVFAISLLPNEELTLEVKTWETSKIQQDREDTTDSRNVSDIKTTSSSANEVTAGQETKTHEYADAKASYSGFGFSASVQAGWSQDVNTMQENIAKQTRERSEQATNEYKTTHKVKMAVSREVGSESKSTRKIRNINQAHTLNANYYEVLREYDVKLELYDVTLVLLGAEPDLTGPTGLQTWWDAIPQDITLGQMIRLSQSGAWVQAAIDRYGVSPLKLLREMWSAPLYHGAPIAADWTDPNVQIIPEDREEFQSTMLQYVRPSPGWVEPDEKGTLRWGYEVLPGQEQAVLEYLYKFLPFSVQQMVARAFAADMEPTRAYQAVAVRYVQSVIPTYKPRLWRQDVTDVAAVAAAPLQVAETETILAPGPFQGKPIDDNFEGEVAEWVASIVEQFNEVVDSRGIKGEWKTTLPTQGVYADLALGVCSGAEDYYEIQRQFDLELKKLEVEKLRLENRLLEQGKSPASVVIENPTRETAINLDIGVSETPTKVEIVKTEN